MNRPDHDLQELDDLIHSKIRLGAMAILASADDAEFTYLRDRLNATDGNLSTHMRRLEEAGYVEVRKSFVDRKPVTRFRLTARGRRAFEEYVDRLERLLGLGGAGASDEASSEGEAR